MSEVFSFNGHKESLAGSVYRPLDIDRSGEVKTRLVVQILGELCWYVLPDWVKPSVTMRRTQRFVIFLTSLVASCFMQALVFLTGDGCQHVPSPAVCHDDESLFDVGAIFRAMWGELLGGRSRVFNHA